MLPPQARAAQGLQNTLGAVRNPLAPDPALPRDQALLRRDLSLNLPPVLGRRRSLKPEVLRELRLRHLLRRLAHLGVHPLLFYQAL